MPGPAFHRDRPSLVADWARVSAMQGWDQPGSIPGLAPG